MNDQIEQELEIIRESVLQIVPTEAIYLFGSYAYGVPREDSDLDIYVVVPDDVKNLGELYGDIRKRIRLNKRQAQLNMLRPLDLSMGRSSRFEYRKKGPTLEKIISNRGRVLYER